MTIGNSWVVYCGRSDAFRIPKANGLYSLLGVSVSQMVIHQFSHAVIRGPERALDPRRVCRQGGILL